SAKSQKRRPFGRPLGFFRLGIRPFLSHRRRVSRATPYRCNICPVLRYIARSSFEKGPLRNGRLLPAPRGYSGRLAESMPRGASCDDVLAVPPSNLVRFGERGEGIRYRHLAALVALQPHLFEDLASCEAAAFAD